jgi:hypothetical protein
LHLTELLALPPSCRTIGKAALAMADTTVTINAPPAHKTFPFEGFGAQFNTNIFRPEGQPKPLTPAQRNALRATIVNLKPGHSRIFIGRELTDTPTPPQKELKALLNTIELAEKAGANVNLTFWGQGTFAGVTKLTGLQWPNPRRRAWPHHLESKGKLKWPDALLQLPGPRKKMERFAGLVKAIRDADFTCVKYLTIQNEPNGSGTDIAMQKSPVLSMRFYERLYRLLDKALRGVELRDTVDLVAGDLVHRGNSHQDDWLDYISSSMDVPRGPDFPCVVDGYSIHVYWNPTGGVNGFPQKLEARLKALPATLKNLGIEKPLYVTEYGVKVDGPKPEPGGPGSGQKIEFDPEVALQHAWFNALAPQYGCAGLVKWVLYRTDERAHFGEWGMIDAPNPPAGTHRTSFGRSPAYRVTRLFNHLVGRGWKATGLGFDPSHSVVASRFAGEGQQSIVIVNRSDRDLQVVVRGLKPGASYFAADWNRNGSAANQKLPPVNANSQKPAAATVTVPKHGVVSLSTRDLKL